MALLAACYPALLAAVTVMLLLPNPKRLLFGYLLGAYTTGITLGLVIVFSLEDSGAVSTSKRSISPAQDIALGLVLIVLAVVLATGRDEPRRRRRRERKEARRTTKESQKPWSQRMLGSGSARITYAVGVLLSFPGVTYLVALNRIANLDVNAGLTVLLVVSFCLIQLVLLELPLLGYVFAPERTQEAVARFRAWLGRSGRSVGILGSGALGLLLVARGLIGLL